MQPASPPVNDVLPTIDLSQALGFYAAHNWYALAAIGLTLAIQLAKRYQLALWTKTPDGLKMLWPVGLAAATAFVHAQVTGLPLAGALGEVFNSIWAIAIPSMGVNAALRESPISWDGGSGGKEPIKYTSADGGLTWTATGIPDASGESDASASPDAPDATGLRVIQGGVSEEAEDHDRITSPDPFPPGGSVPPSDPPSAA